MMSESDWPIGFICLPNSVCTSDRLDNYLFFLRIRLSGKLKQYFKGVMT